MSGERAELQAVSQIVEYALHRGELHDAEHRRRLAAEDARVQHSGLMVKLERDVTTRGPPASTPSGPESPE